MTGYAASLVAFLFVSLLFGNPSIKTLIRHPPIHVATLMGPFMVVVVQVGIEILLHLLDRLVPGFASFDSEVLVQQGSVQTLNKAVVLRPANFGGSMLDAFELQKQLVGMLIRPTAVLPAIVRENGCDCGIVLLEERQDVFIEHMHGRDRQLAGVEPSPGVAGMTVDHRLQIDPTNAFQGANEECVRRNQIASVLGFDVALSDLRTEPLQKADLIVAQFKVLFSDPAFKAKQALMPGQKVVATPDTTNTTGTDLDPLKSQLLRDPERPMSRKLQAVLENRLFDGFIHPVRVWPFGPRQAVKQALCAIGLVVAADFIKLLTGVTHNATGLADVVQFGSEL